MTFVGAGQVLRSVFGILSASEEGPPSNTYLDSLDTPHDGSGVVSVSFHSGNVMGKWGGEGK